MPTSGELPSIRTRIQKPIGSEPFHRWEQRDGKLWSEFYKLDAGYLLRFPELADFEVSEDGRDVRAWSTPRTPTETLRHLYLNQVLPLVASRQGALALHAGATEIGDCAVAFAGTSGSGKSTLVASFAAEGRRFLTDDGLKLEKRDGRFQVMPSHNAIRLCNDSGELITGKRRRTQRKNSKQRLVAGGTMQFCDQPRPLSAIFLLKHGDSAAPQIRRVEPREALTQLAANAFFLSSDEPDLLSAHFEHLCDLAALDLTYTLDYPLRYELLADVRALVAQHVENQANGRQAA